MTDRGQTTARAHARTEFIPIVRMRERLRRSRDDSDVSYFFDLMNAGELCLKLIVASLTACLRRDPEDHQYRIESGLVRADGLGEWVRALEQLLIGPASEHLSLGGREAQRQLTETVSKADWRFDALKSVEFVANSVDSDHPAFRKAQLRQWLTTFVWLRNKTRGHGAISATTCGDLAPPLADSIDALFDNVLMFGWPWAVIRRGISGKYRVSSLGGSREPFLDLTRRTDLAFDDGVYVGIDEPAHVRLAYSDVDLGDFFVANGQFSDQKYEALSYATGNRRDVDSARYLRPPSPLPDSETHARSSLGVRDNVLTNAPMPRPDYVTRASLETEVIELLRDDRRPVVTLGGRGGIGKTSLALQVIDQLTHESRYDNVWWFSSRDIDLLAAGPKQVRPDILNLDDIAREFASLAFSGDKHPSNAERTALLMRWLAGEADGGTSLFVFDNFETVESPGDVFRWLDQVVRLPNKVLITTRVRGFRGDYPVDVAGMEEDEFRVLVGTVSRELGIEALVSDDYASALYAESDGHPYVAKILLGEAARTGRTASVERIMATREDVLTALFERTFALSLTPSAQRVFLTLSAWRSIVPELALKAALLRPVNKRIDVDSAVDELIRSSLVESEEDPGGERFLSVPLAAQLFGRSKLRISAWKAAIESDLTIIQAFGATQDTDVRRGLGPRIDALFRAIGDGLEDALPVLEFVATRYPPAWLLLADLAKSRGDNVAQAEAVGRYVEAQPHDPRGWRRLAVLARIRGDVAGEMNSLLQLSELPATPYREISETADRFNYLAANRQLNDAWGEKQVMAQRLRQLMEARIAEADSYDLSRLGWICMHLRDVNAGREYAHRSLGLDSHNPRAKRLLGR